MGVESNIADYVLLSLCGINVFCASATSVHNHRKRPGMNEVLVIDDDAATMFRIASAIAGARFVSAQTALEGLQLARAKRSSLGLIVVSCSGSEQDYGTICLLLRDEAPQVPILPLLSGKQAPLRKLFRELHCAEPLSMPLDQALVEPAVRAALQQPPSPIPASGLLSWAKQRAREWERQARTEQQGGVLVYAAQRRDRIYLRQLLGAAGATVIGEAGDQATLDRLVLRAYRRPIIVTIAAEAAPLAAYAAVQQLPMLALAPDLTSGLSLAHNPHRATPAWPTLSIVVDDPADEAAVPLHLALALQRVAQGEGTIPQCLVTPFKDTGLSPQEQTTALLDLLGYDSKEIAAWMQLNESTVRDYRSRVRIKLGLESGEALTGWAEKWWQEARKPVRARQRGADRAA